jgi:adenosylhomocysteine nucleosidase
MPKLAIVAALEREVSALIKHWTRTEREHEGGKFIFFEHANVVCVCGGIGVQSARRAAQAVIALYHPDLIQSVGFAGSLDANFHVGDILAPAVVLDARDGSRFPLAGGNGMLVTFMEVAGASQKIKLGEAYAAQAIDMEAAAVAAAASTHSIPFGATKVISDEIDFEIPAMSRFITSNGRFHTMSFVLFVIPRPWLWKRVMVLARNSRIAASALAQHLQQLILSPGQSVIAPLTRTAGDRN